MYSNYFTLFICRFLKKPKLYNYCNTRTRVSKLTSKCLERVRNSLFTLIFYIRRLSIYPLLRFSQLPNQLHYQLENRIRMLKNIHILLVCIQITLLYSFVGF